MVMILVDMDGINVAYHKYITVTNIYDQDQMLLINFWMWQDPCLATKYNWYWNFILSMKHTHATSMMS